MSTELLDDPLESNRLVVEAAAPAGEEADGEAFAELLSELDPSDATWLLAEWATSSDRRKRMSAARALRGKVSVVGVPTAIEVLAGDRHPEVRRAAAEAAAARLPELPMRLVSLLEQLAKDDRRSVRLHAIDGLRRAVSLGLARDTLS